MALDRTPYMQSSKTFVMVDSPFWNKTDSTTGYNVMGMTLTDREHPGHLPLRQRTRPPGGDLSHLCMDERRHEGATQERR